MPAASDDRVCRRCGILLVNEATRTMGICGDCILKAESQPAPMKRPSYGKSQAVPKPEWPSLE